MGKKSERYSALEEAFRRTIQDQLDNIREALVNVEESISQAEMDQDYFKEEYCNLYNLIPDFAKEDDIDDCQDSKYSL